MSLLGKKFPAPYAKPMFPFFAAGLIVLYGLNSVATTMMHTDEFKHHPRNPYATPPPSKQGEH